MNTLALLAMTDMGAKALAAAIAILVAGAAAIGRASPAEIPRRIARQPEADKKISKTLILGLVFLETCVIYALVVAILIIFVLG